MLQADEIEEDYFTPASSTTLANIFDDRADNQKAENESLKYTPPKPQNVVPKAEDTKATQCVFACALFGYEWSNNAYRSKGKLGFAIIKIVKTGYHNIVLYDSNKTTLSSTTVSPNLEISVTNNVYISYFDNMQKYWNLYSTEEEVNKIVSTLRSLNAVVKYSSDIDKGPPPVPIKNDFKAQSSPQVLTQVDIESDTDSSINKRTKQSILNRMANMGHSVLPPNTLANEKMSDSSDTNESNNYSKTVPIRHKPIKSSIKRNSADKSLEIQSLVEAHKTTRTETFVESGHLVPVTSSNIIMGSSNNAANELSIFMSEQRINNTEMRINMTRVTDKVDQVLSKVSDLAQQCSNNLPTNLQNDILQKLLNEYETKIKTYEEILKCKGLDKNVNKPTSEESLIQPNNEICLLDEKLSEVLEINKEKESHILMLQTEIKSFKDNLAELETNNLKLVQENQSLKQELLNKNLEIETQKCAINENNDSSKTEDIIKNILNDMFHTISANFENNENYRGDAIKSIIAKVIKTAFEHLKQDK